MENYSEFVHRALEQLGTLRAQGEREAEENKATLTRRAAYLIHQVNPNIGLLRKETGNNVMGLSVDLILDRTNGEFADIASDVDDGDGFRRTTAVFLPKHDPALMPRWVQPTAALAGLAEPSHPEPQTTTQPQTTTTHPQTTTPQNPLVLAAAQALLREATVRFDAIDARLSSLEASLRRSANVQDQTLEAVTRALGVIQHLGTVPRP
jgi:hypothetical protein